MIEANSPYKIHSIRATNKYECYGYFYRYETVTIEGCGADPVEMQNFYSLDTGDWIGDAKTAQMVCEKYGLRDVQKRDPKHHVASIGFNRSREKWYGWSHRAIAGFGVGQTVLVDGLGEVMIKTLEEAKECACDFASEVS